MGYEGGHIYGPVNTDDVVAVTGLNSHDVATLCTNENLNPHSLIRPLYVNTPNFTPDKFENMPEMGTVPQGDNQTYWYQHMKWGYWVPFTSSPAMVSEMYDVPWERNFPKAGDNSFKILNHFDGYRNDAEPKLPISATIEAGENIVLRLFPGNPQIDIINTEGGNNGGVVAVPDVLGAVRIGCSLYENAMLRGHYIAADPIVTTGQLAPMVAIDTKVTAVPGKSYIVVAWATDGNIVNGTAVSGSKFFNLTFGDDAWGVISKKCDDKVVAITNATVTKVGGELRFAVTLSNGLESQQTVDNFTLAVEYMSGNTSKSRTVALSGASSVNIPAKSKTTVNLTLNDNDIVNNYQFISSMVVKAIWRLNYTPIESYQLAAFNRPPIANS